MGGGSIEISIKFLWFHWQRIISVSKERFLGWESVITVRQPKGRKYCFGSHQVSLRICFKAWYGQGWPFSAYEDDGAKSSYKESETLSTPGLSVGRTGSTCPFALESGPDNLNRGNKSSLVIRSSCDSRQKYLELLSLERAPRRPVRSDPVSRLSTRLS